MRYLACSRSALESKLSHCDPALQVPPGPFSVFFFRLHWSQKWQPGSLGSSQAFSSGPRTNEKQLSGGKL